MTTPQISPRILIVDDTEFERTALGAFLQRNFPNVKCDTAQSGDEAKKKIAEAYYDVVVMDYHLSAHELGSHVARDICSNRTPTVIIGYTTYAEEAAVVNDCKNSGMVTVLPKRFNAVCTYLKGLFQQYPPSPPVESQEGM